MSPAFRYTAPRIGFSLVHERIERWRLDDSHVLPGTVGTSPNRKPNRVAGVIASFTVRHRGAPLRRSVSPEHTGAACAITCEDQDPAPYESSAVLTATIYALLCPLQ